MGQFQTKQARERQQRLVPAGSFRDSGTCFRDRSASSTFRVYFLLQKFFKLIFVHGVFVVAAAAVCFRTAATCLYPFKVPLPASLPAHLGLWMTRGRRQLMSHFAGLVSAEISLHSRSLGSFPTELSPEGAGFFSLPPEPLSLSISLSLSLSASVSLCLPVSVFFPLSLCLSPSLSFQISKQPLERLTIQRRQNEAFGLGCSQSRAHF